LGLLSLVGGMIGMPHVLGVHNYFHGFLHLGSEGPALGPADHHLELVLMGASIVVAALAALGAMLIYLKFPDAPKRWAKSFGDFYQLILNKYFVDEFYDATVVQPIRKGSENFLSGVVDEKIIDGTLVNGSGRLASWAGSLVSRFQGGLVNRYAFYFLIGIACFALFMVVY